MKTESNLEQKAQKALEASIIYYQGRPVGTVAARDPYTEALNYDQCFVRDFVSSALAFLMQGKTEIVRNFLSVTLTLQSCEKRLDCFKPGQGLMPASFKVESNNGEEFLVADFGEQAIARVTPIDSCLWWLILLRAIATQVIEIAESCLDRDEWPEYYDGRYGRLIGKEARFYQTWTIAGYLIAKQLVKNPQHLSLISFDDDFEVIACSL